MANDSGLNPVTPNSSERSAPQCPLRLALVHHAASRCAPGTLAWSWALCPLVPTQLHPAARVTAPDGLQQGWSLGKSHLRVWGPRCCVPVQPSSPVPRARQPQAPASPCSGARPAACGSALPALHLGCPKKLTKLKLFAFLGRAFK